MIGILCDRLDSSPMNGFIDRSQDGLLYGLRESGVGMDDVFLRPRASFRLSRSSRPGRADQLRRGPNRFSTFSIAVFVMALISCALRAPSSLREISFNDDNPLRHFLASPFERLGFFRRTAQVAFILENQVGKSRHIGFPPNSWAGMVYIEVEGCLFVSLPRVISKAKSLLFV